MATALEIQAELDAQGTGTKIRIIKENPVGPAFTKTLFYCIAGVVRPGISRWCETTAAQTAAQQATAITNAMTA